ncbi:MAG: acyltransferase family protein [Clostridiales bacterium]|nr:acyltransferase family protein [Clostridiales bacterium]
MSSMTERRNKTNKKFMALSALGIFMVVDHHTFITFNFFGDFIPYNSFFMPMFVFISGYFNKVDSETKLLPYIWKKIKSLLIPYVFLSALAFGLQFLIDWYKTGEVPSVPDGYMKYLLERAVTIGSSISIAEPMWFVISLFAVLVVYALLKKCLGKIWNSFVALGIFTCLHVFSVDYSMNLLEDASPYLLLPLKILFFLPFLEMGIIYRKYLEKKHEAMPVGGKIALLFGLLIMNMVRMLYLPVPYDVAFDALGEMMGFTSPFTITPMVSSIVGILFWLTLVDLIGKPLYESKFVNYMSSNTFWIMGLHIAFFNIVNCILMFINNNLIGLKYFNVELFQITEWYFWDLSPNLKLLYLVAGILGPLGLKWICDLICSLPGRRKQVEEPEKTETKDAEKTLETGMV